MRLLEKSAKEILNPEQLRLLWKGIDIIGDIAILKIPQELESARFQIAQKLLAHVPNITVVLRQVGPVESPFRTRRLEWLAGQKRTETIHKEFGCQYKLDLKTVYFSPRLSYERKRVADLVSKGECIVNFFAGVGSFSIMIARHASPSRIYSLDLNPIAARYHRTNNLINRVDDAIDVICGDANAVVSTSLVGRVHRALLPLPELALDSLTTARTALKDGHGIIHCYAFVDARNRDEVAHKALLKFSSSLHRIGAAESNTQAHVVRSVGPCLYQVCLDIRL
jgi:tRNA (guanine37-N1)-methyltransferase